MQELYWITRLDYIQGALRTIIFASLFVFLFLLLILPAIDEHSPAVAFTRYKKWFIGLTSSMLVAGVLYVFTPNTKEALLIYGVGGAIDYIKENKTAVELPDKIIIAIDKYIEELNTEKESNMTKEKQQE